MAIAIITTVIIPPKMYASVRFSIPNIMGEMKMYDEQTYVIITAGSIEMIVGFSCLER